MRALVLLRLGCARGRWWARGRLAVWRDRGDRDEHEVVRLAALDALLAAWASCIPPYPLIVAADRRRWADTEVPGDSDGDGAERGGGTGGDLWSADAAFKVDESAATAVGVNDVAEATVAESELEDPARRLRQRARSPRRSSFTCWSCRAGQRPK